MQTLREFLMTEIVPRYDAFDAGHRRDHALHVMAQGERLAQFYPDVDPDMVLTACAYHDLGLAQGRELHHVHSADIIRADERLRRWFTQEQIEVIADAAEDHRASNRHEPRTIYGRIVAEADRLIDPETVIRRTVQYGFAHYPSLDREAHYRRMVEHLNEKYARGGYLKLWIPESDNARNLETLRRIIEDPDRLQALFDRFYDEYTRQM